MATNTQQGSIKVIWTEATVDFASTAANDITDSSAITLTGAALGDPVVLGDTVTPPAKGCFYAHVTAADEVKVRFVNNDDAAVDPASRTFRVAILKLNAW